MLKKELWVGKKNREGGGGGNIVIQSASTSTRIPSHKTSQKKKNDINNQYSKHMSSSKTGKVAKNYKMLANPVFVTPGRYISIYTVSFCLLVA